MRSPICVLLLAGCGFPTVGPRAWWNVSSAEVERARADNVHHGVYLRLHKALEYHANEQYEFQQVHRAHGALVVLSEAMREVFKLSVIMPRRGSIPYFDVRIRKRDGRVVQIGKDRLLSKKLEEDPDEPDRAGEKKLLVIPDLEVGDVVEYQYAAVGYANWRVDPIALSVGWRDAYQHELPIREYRWEHSFPDNCRTS